MSGLVNALLIVAVVVVVIARQFRARPISTGRRFWLLPVILAVVALREPGILDAHHRTESALLLATEVLVGLGLGAGWAWTTRVWTEADGVVWTKSTKASAAVWFAGIAVRVGLYALGAVVGVHQDSSALMLGLAVTLLVRSGILVWRAQTLPSAASASGPTRAYGDDMARVTRKEGV
ncbi:CcdC protein domain-containing protein [Streptomyces sp. GbtcB6]|uniref:CcdC protein domain-containing protein n=1 Tax=Streptomyces sp. GbtcB6 TaxID=2824751 RepID=UPI001C2FAC4B|nr:CcdC protein domain-containing protein [Streptomyces sp. GbtcB6]